MIDLHWALVCELVLALPSVEESTSYGTPALKVARKLFARLHQDGENLVVRMEKPDRARRMAEMPDVFHVTDHYVGDPYVLVRLAKVSREDLSSVLVAAWRLVAPKKLIEAYDREC